MPTYLSETMFVILGDPDDSATALNACLDKDFILSFMRPWFGEGLITANALTWKKNHKLLYPMFSLQQVRRYLPVFNLQARRLVKRFTEHENKGAFTPELHVLLVSFETICHKSIAFLVSFIGKRQE
ncbi:Uncharacterized protein OBRU01_18303 [Operophtera brumata]|uniref:Cytochrome P450 n=1 Tax=Operophtera brumata TaxID=104452 RepID=A0A0L7KZA7_OPEBR|nr:Uncharacterized protein OBRU01_18303 [Operophtera brumata]